MKSFDINYKHKDNRAPFSTRLHANNEDSVKEKFYSIYDEVNILGITEVN